MDEIKAVSVAGWHQGVEEEQEKTCLQLAASVCNVQVNRGCPWQAPKRDSFSPVFCVAQSGVWFYSQDKEHSRTGQLTSAESSGAVGSGSSQVTAASAEPGLRSQTVFGLTLQNLWESLQSAGDVRSRRCSLAKHRGMGASPCARAGSYLIAEDGTGLVGACAQHVL